MPGRAIHTFPRVSKTSPDPVVLEELDSQAESS